MPNGDGALHPMKPLRTVSSLKDAEAVLNCSQSVGMIGRLAAEADALKPPAKEPIDSD